MAFCLTYGRREQGYCLICFSADSPNDVSIGGWILANKKAAVAVCKNSIRMVNLVMGSLF